MALHCDPDMVRTIVGASQVKFLSGPAGVYRDKRYSKAQVRGRVFTDGDFLVASAVPVAI
jgi:hypothetical protein